MMENSGELAMATKKPENMSFEDAIGELEKIVNKLEQGELSLDEALKQFERGISLARSSGNKLKTAEQQVQILLQKDGESELVKFEE